jgi:hypothetical protein
VARTRSAHPWRWGIGGFVIGVLATIVLLALLAPRGAALAPSTGTGNVSISIDDAFIAHQAARGFALVALPFSLSNVRAHIAAGNTVSISGDAQTPAGASQLAATTRLSVANGHLVSQLTDAEVGALPLPAPLTAALDAAINGQLASATDQLMPTGSGLSLSGIRTSDGHLTLLVTSRG